MPNLSLQYIFITNTVKKFRGSTYSAVLNYINTCASTRGEVVWTRNVTENDIAETKLYEIDKIRLKSNH